MIRLDNVSKVFGTGVAGLTDVTLFVDKGEFVFLVGHTGSGKTTLLRLLVRETLPTQGTIIVGDFDIVKLPKNKIPHLRKKVGVVFQDLRLLVDRTILENIILPMQVAGGKIEEATKRADELLQMVGLSEHRDKYPIQLSGGELQRVAIARALALSPEILLADEPTGNLDPQTALEIVQLLEKINQMGTTIIMATHNIEIVNKLKKRVVALEKGKVIKDEKHGHAKVYSGEETKLKQEEKSLKKEKETPVILNESEGSKEDSSAMPQNDNKGEDLKLEGHKKETKKLSDLLAKARKTLQRSHHEKSNPDPSAGSGQDLPFGFEKEEDVKESSEEEKTA